MKTLQNPQYNPSALLDYAMSRLDLKNDAALALTLKVAPPVISKIRNGRLPIGASMLVRLHEELGTGTMKLKEIAGMVA